VPCVELSSVEDMFFALQKTHREAQAELNSMRHDMEMSISKENDIRTEEYNTLMSEYQKIRHGHTVSYETWKQTSLEEARNLKIIIPAQLQGIYQEINNLGK
jgi:archaellum component FlaC